MVHNYQCYVGNFNALWALFMIGEIARMSPGYNLALPPMSLPVPRVRLGAEDLDDVDVRLELARAWCVLNAG